MSRYDDDKRYLVSGAELNALHHEDATNRIIAGAGLGFRRLPGQGTEVWATGASGAGGWLWGVEVTDAATGTIRLVSPGQIRATADVAAASLVPLLDSETEWTMSVGDFLLIDLHVDDGALAAKLVKLATWPNFPWPWATEPDEHDFEQVTHSYFPLWRAIPTPLAIHPRRHVAIKDGLALLRLAPDADLAVEDRLEEMPGGQMIQALALTITHAVYDAV